MPYSRSVKVGILKKVLPPERRSIASVSDETGISSQTIRNWIKEAKSDSLDGKAAELFYFFSVFRPVGDLCLIGIILHPLLSC